LVLDDYMERGVNPGIGQSDARGAVMRFGQMYSFLLVERKPFDWIWCDFWVVVGHGISLPD